MTKTQKNENITQIQGGEMTSRPTEIATAEFKMGWIARRSIRRSRRDMRAI